MGSRLGAVFGLAVMPLCVERWGWRESFILLGVFGAIWAAIWFWRFRDAPGLKLNADKPQVAPASREQVRAIPIDKVPLQAFVSSRNFYLILFQYFASNFTFFICFSWLLPFLRERYAITSGEAGLYSSIPLLCGALATWSGGVAVDRIFKAGNWKMSRALPAIFGFGLAAVTLLPAPLMRSPGWFIACFALTTFGVDLTLSSSWTVCCDVGGQYSGTLSAAMNTLGAIGSFASSLLFPFLIGRVGSIKTYFYLAALLDIVALGCWVYIEPTKSISSFEKRSPAALGR
jgi:ACS family glucarate transporter-like MFS transporter